MVRPSYATILLALALLVASTEAEASKERVATLESVRLVSDGGPSFGQIVVELRSSPTQDVVEITIRFLGKSFTVPSHITDRLPKFLNGLQLSTDVGVGGPGGRTVYLVLKRGFVSGTAERMVVSISHAGEITLVPSSP